MKKTKDKLSKIAMMQASLEKEGLFTHPCSDNADYFDPETILKADNDFKYIDESKKRRFLERRVHNLVAVFSLFLGLYYGVRIKGKKYLKEIEDTGAISVSNHILYLDCMLVKRALLGKYRLHYIVAEKNNLKGSLGELMRLGGTIPIGSTLRANMNFNKAIKYRLEQKRCVQIYPEEEMWLRYRKPRPLNIGAFELAVMNNVPVIPIFFTYKENNKIRKFFKLKNKIVINILKPLKPDMTLERKQTSKKLMDDCEQLFRECYEEAYNLKGQPLYDITQSGKEKIKSHKAFSD